MKTLKLIFMLFSLVVVAGCENYPDSDIEYTPIFPLSGEWRVRITDMSTGALVTNTMYTLGTYNTSDNDKDQMWLRITSNMSGGIGTLRGKISCNVADLSFGATDVSDISVSPAAVFSITEGKITLDAIDMPSKVKSDKISFKYTTGKVQGKTYLFEGYRRTLWNEDETFRDF